MENRGNGKMRMSMHIDKDIEISTKMRLGNHTLEEILSMDDLYEDMSFIEIGLNYILLYVYKTGCEIEIKHEDWRDMDSIYRIDMSEFLSYIKKC